MGGPLEPRFRICVVRHGGIHADSTACPQTIHGWCHRFISTHTCRHVKVLPTTVCGCIVRRRDFVAQPYAGVGMRC